MSRISDKVYDLCRNGQSVSSSIAADPSLTPGEAAKHLFHPDTFSISEGNPPVQRVPASEEDLQRAYDCGKWGPTRPSELFLRIFHDSLLPLEHDPLVSNRSCRVGREWLILTYLRWAVVVLRLWEVVVLCL